MKWAHLGNSGATGPSGGQDLQEPRSFGGRDGLQAGVWTAINRGVQPSARRRARRPAPGGSIHQRHATSDTIQGKPMWDRTVERHLSKRHQRWGTPSETSDHQQSMEPVVLADCLNTSKARSPKRYCESEYVLLVSGSMKRWMSSSSDASVRAKNSS